MIQILKRFGWTWAGLLVSDDDYGLHVAQSFQSQLIQSGLGCLAYSEILPWGENPSELRRIVEVMKKSTARVVIVFAHQINMIQLMEEVSIFLSLCLMVLESKYLVQRHLSCKIQCAGCKAECDRCAVDGK